MAKKAQLGYKEIEARLITPLSPWEGYGVATSGREGGAGGEAIGYNLLYAFGKSERDIQRYKEGKGVLKTFDGLLIKGLFCYRGTTTTRLASELELLKRDVQVLKAAPKIVAVSDGETLLAYDLREKDTYENKVDRLYCDFAFFYPLMDVERVHYVEESPADIKAAEKLAKLHDELRAYNEFRSDSDLHDLNIFITRLLFCFFAEDTGIFEENLFTSSIIRYTKDDGSDLTDYLARTFNIMDVSLRSAETLSIIKQFPYVNGGLFSRRIQIPRMGQKARKIIIECGELDWKDINPDIFGSMIQAVVNPEERASQGMHYTSVPNIMKVINPLFLDELRGEYNKLNEHYEQLLQLKKIGAKKEKDFYAECRPISRQCEALLKRMSKMKFFDPACGSGNFLIITYKSLRFLEMDILSLQQKCLADTQSMFVDASVISLNQFYGIELLDFPHEVAMLSLWLAEHQMNTKLNAEFGVNTKALPLKNITQIVCGNACRLDWNTICPHTPEEEVFIFGNPPYLGTRKQTSDNKKDMNMVFAKYDSDYKKLDYIACWFVKGAEYMNTSNALCAFVSTNSITQGEQVSLLWPLLFRLDVKISFAYLSFKWSNNAKHNAGVTCVIIGLTNKESKRKLYNGSEYIICDNINPYLYSGSDSIVVPLNKNLSGLPQMLKGCAPGDGGNLLLYKEERDMLLSSYPELYEVIKPFLGADEIINGYMRYCLWLDETSYQKYSHIREIYDRVERCRAMRLDSTKEATVKKAATPWLFDEIRYQKGATIIVPQTSSENRTYIPIYYSEKDIIYSNGARVVFNGQLWLFGILTSKIHNCWAQVVSGRLETRIQYSNTLCYNTFPFPKISAEKKAEIEEAAENVLVTREFYPDKTLADLYDPDKMPQDLREAHAKLDDIVESCYPGYPFATDEARLECLFKLYEKMKKNGYTICHHNAHRQR